MIIVIALLLLAALTIYAWVHAEPPHESEDDGFDEPGDYG